MADSFTSSTVQSGESAAIVRKGVAIAGIQVSVKKSEAHTYTSQATELAMESGATVTDHVILKPVTLAVTVAMTNAGDGRDAARDAFESFVEMRKKARTRRGDHRTLYLYEYGDHQSDAHAFRPIQGRIGNRDHFPAGQFCRTAKCRAVAVNAEREREKDRGGAGAVGQSRGE